MLTLELPLSPSINEMIELAKQRTRRSRSGGWMKASLPVVYDQHLERYEMMALAALRKQRATPPATPWPTWQLVSAELRVHNLRDWTELLGSLKWPIDVLVRLKYVRNDSPREMAPPPIPTQRIDRKTPGVVLVIAPWSPPPKVPNG